MASASESAGKETAAVKWEVGPTEDVVQALMEKLVDPRLPLRVSGNDPPSEDARKSVARQIHAVVLLYNYYHRKQNLELEFLDCVSFCKLALLLRPSLISFMKVMSKSEPMELNAAEDHLSVTEKAIKDACDIAMALDASKDVPTVEGCAISKVAVLLIDSRKENCLLQFGAVTEGVWSLIEKGLSESDIDEEIVTEEKVGKRRKRNSQEGSTDDGKSLQVGYDAVKDITGIDSSDLVVLETRVVYSLSKAKTAAQFYMMHCPKSFSINQSVPLKFLVESLQGPLAEKYYDSWTATTVVEYYHMLPYVGFISSWLGREALCLPCLNDYNARSTTNSGEKDLDHTDNNSSETEVSSSDKIAKESSEHGQKKGKYSSGGEVASSVDIFQITSKDGNATDEFNKKYYILDSALKEEWEAGLLSGSSRGLSQTIVKDNNIVDKFNERCDSVDSAEKEESRVDLEIVHTDGKNNLKGLTTRRQSQNTMTDEKFNKKCGMVDSARKDESRIYSEIVDNDNYECLKGSSSGPSRGLQRMNMNDSTKTTCLKSEDTSKKLDSKIRVYHHRRKDIFSTQNDTSDPEDGVDLKAEIADPLKPNDTPCINEKATADGSGGNVTISCNQGGIAATESPPAQFDVSCNIEVQNVLASEDLQNALALLYQKRQELYSQICIMEDALALYEDKIERIRDGGEVGLARECIKSILSGKTHLLQQNEPSQDHCNPQSEKQTRLSDAFLPGISACQDLEYICFKNNWRFPKYVVEPSDGRFLANVAVESKDLKLSSNGGWESSPCEARESAATRMIARIQSDYVIISHNLQSM